MVFIQEAAEDPTFLPGLSSCERFSLRYYPAENDVSNDLYEYAAAKKGHGRVCPAGAGAYV